DDLTKHLKEGDSVQAMIINVDRKNRSINLTVKAKDLSEESDAMKQLRSENAAASAGATNLGALLRAKLDKGGSNPEKYPGIPPRGGKAGMTKSELIARLAQRYPQLVAKDAEYAVKMILDAMTQSLLIGRRLELRGFGSFGLNYRP